VVLDPATRIITFLHARDYVAAERLLGALLENEPGDAPTRSLRALCLAELDRFADAEAEARLAVETEPYLAYCHWALGSVLADRRRWKDALEAAHEALEMEPENADSHALLGRCLVGLRRWDEALATADEGLELEPDHPGCANLRAIILQQRGRDDEAEQAFVDAAATDPDNAFARAGRGWSALRRGGTPEPAIEHFQHALRIDPHIEWAREGLLASLKARNPVYRAMLRYFLWMDGMGRGARFMIVGAGLIGYNQARRLTEARPETAPFLYPLMGLYLLFVLLTWVADPVFDFLLRFDPQGRRMVPRHRAVAGTAVVALLAVAVVTAGVGIATGDEDAFLPALMLGLLTIPVAGIFRVAAGWPRTALALYVAAVAAAGAAGVVVGGPAGDGLLGLSLLGLVVGSWISLGLAAARPAR
jgi:tetratricopeptide (TPR) repeat protein